MKNDCVVLGLIMSFTFVLFVCGHRPKTKELLELLFLFTFWLVPHLNEIKWKNFGCVHGNRTLDLLILSLSLYQLRYKMLRCSEQKNYTIASDLGPVLVELLVCNCYAHSLGRIGRWRLVSRLQISWTFLFLLSSNYLSSFSFRLLQSEQRVSKDDRPLPRRRRRRPVRGGRQVRVTPAREVLSRCRP